MIDLRFGDCLEIMPSIPNNSVDMILCDLPYGTTQCKWDIVIPFESLWKEYKRIIKDRGCIALFGSEPFSSYLRMSNIKQYKYDWIWKKNNKSNFLSVRWVPLKEHENICIFYKKPGKYKPEINILKKPIMKKNRGTNLYNKIDDCLQTKTGYPSSVLEYKCERKIHDNQKPVALLEYLIKTYTLEGETVLDNCMGSGSTGVACVNTNRNFIGIEKEQEYFEIAQKRILG